jgi:hypothetical protein
MGDGDHINRTSGAPNDPGLDRRVLQVMIGDTRGRFHLDQAIAAITAEQKIGAN